MSDDVLFDECIEALGDKVIILDMKESDRIFDIFEKKLPIASPGRVDWDSIQNKKTIRWNTHIIPAIRNLLQRPFDERVYVLWNDGSVPVVVTELNLVVKFFNDVISVGPDTWLVNFEEGYVVEIFHDGEMNVGLIPQK